ncbi:uncharacterized protein LOC123299839 [Chrysoperla carnea]|uniref:uncharacterized protein LOC123299839 n=1 Tax=Chrysoperla carnea TaxID=189513 RepID=UPI001D05CFD8|nr:uncharacterized protein LOC123299839 [Chrysoperla carnea]
MLGDTWRPLDCVFCNNQPQNPPIFSCKAGHLVCSSCYGVLLHQIDAKKIHLIHCKLCNAEITNTRNLIAELLVENASNLKSQEALLPKLKTISSSDSSSESTYLSNRGSKPRSYNGLELPNTSDNSSMLNVKSRRPICCPEYTCRHMVAVASLVSHFEFEHPRALKLELVPDVREDFVVSSDIFNQTYYYLIVCFWLATIMKQDEIVHHCR